MSKLEDK